MAASARSTALLAQIAATLNVPVEHFTAPRREPTEAERSPAVQVAALLLDPEGARVAAAFAGLPRTFRVALANTAESLAGYAEPPVVDQAREPR